MFRLMPQDGFRAVNHVNGYGCAGVFDIWRPICKALQKAGFVEGHSTVLSDDGQLHSSFSSKHVMVGPIVARAAKLLKLQSYVLIDCYIHDVYQ